MSEKCDHFGNIEPCEHAHGAEDGAWVCFHCSKNTTKGVWPTQESLPVVPTINATGNLPAPSPDDDLQSTLTIAPDLLGDKIAAMAEKWGADKLAAAYERMTGLPCGCAGRRELLNRLDGFVRGLLPQRAPKSPPSRPAPEISPLPPLSPAP